MDLVEFDSTSVTDLIDNMSYIIFSAAAGCMQGAVLFGS